jgi:hypothetical protein
MSGRAALTIGMRRPADSPKSPSMSLALSASDILLDSNRRWGAPPLLAIANSSSGGF